MKNEEDEENAPPAEYEAASEEEIDTYYAWEYRPEYEQALEEEE